jgi:hypothetical protein
MSIRCAHCRGRHDTVAEVKSCSVEHQCGPVTTGRAPVTTLMQDTLTEGKQRYLSDLLGQFYLKLAGDLTVETIGYNDGNKILQALIDARRNKTMGKPFTFPDGVEMIPNPRKPRERTPTRPQLPDVPEGYYAVPGSLLGYDKNDLYFYRVDRPTEGQWAGRTFLKSVIGGKPEWGKFSQKELRQVLNAILEFGLEEANILFAVELKHCRKCNLHLTKWASRQLLYGPDCAEQIGLGADWRALDAKARAEGLDDK